ncbi:MAG: MFS transporter [Actinobacteria bacterium]|nr:MFS transporter [Actinomycetota bacterium]
MAESVDQFADIRRRHVLATFLFSLGSSMVSIVTAYIVYQQSGSVAVSGLIMVCSSLPAVLLPAPATAIARRWGGPKDYVYSRLAIGVVGFIPVVLSMTGRITTVNLLLWFLLSGILYALSGPATSLIRATVAIIPVGFALTMDTTILGSLIQIASQSGSRNAVLSGYAMLPALFAPMGQELIGLASDRFSVGTALAAVAVVVGISVVVGAVSGGHLTLRRDLNALSEAEGPPAAAVSLPRSGGSSHEGSLPVGALAGP